MFCRDKIDRRKAQQIDLEGTNVLNSDNELDSGLAPVVSGLKYAWGRFVYLYFNWRKVRYPLLVYAFPSIEILRGISDINIALLYCRMLGLMFSWSC